MEILNVEDLTFTYAGADAPTLKDIGLSVNEGEFVLICGATGSGKSTLLKMFKEELRPNGEMSGNITFHGESDKPRIGFVMQNPAEQTVTDKVWHELAFGMENCGFPQSRMAVRSAEMAAFFGIEDWYMKDVNEL